jgi:hypothetical protein
MNVLDRSIGVAGKRGAPSVDAANVDSSNVDTANVAATDVDAIGLDGSKAAGRMPDAPVPRAEGRGPHRLVAALRVLWQFLVRQSFSSLTRRIVFLNIAGLLALVIGILSLSQFRAGLIGARVESLQVQGEIIAGAIAAQATADSDAITIDPERLQELQLGESYDPEESASGLDFTINPERVAPVLRRLVSPTKTRARLYDRDGVLILDTRNLYDVVRFDLPPTATSPDSSSVPSTRPAPGSTAATCRSIASSGRLTARATRRSSTRSTAPLRA